MAASTSGNFISANPLPGLIDLYDTNGVIIKSINVWEEDDGWPYDYTTHGRYGRFG